MKKYLLNFILVFSSVLLVSCGGGGGGSNSTGVNNNTGPSQDNTHVIPTVSLDSSNGGVADGAANTSLTPMVVLKFSDQMNPVTINSENVFISTSASVKDAVSLSSIVPDETMTSFSFSPREPLVSKTKYYIIVTGTSTTSNVSVSGQFTFTTGDFVKPVVTMVNPLNGESNVSNNPMIELQFSETVQNVESSIILYENKVGGTKVNITKVTLNAGNRYSFSPVSPLKDNNTYYVVVSNNVKDLSGNATDQSTFNFTTGNFSNPTVTLISPVANTTGLSLNPMFAIRFSESVVNPITLQNIRLYDPTTNNYLPFNLHGFTAFESYGPNSYAFIIKGGLITYHNYVLVIESSVTDLAGNKLKRASFPFTTGDVMTLLSAGGNQYVANNGYLFWSNDTKQNLTIDSVSVDNPAVTLAPYYTSCETANNKCIFNVIVDPTLTAPTLVKVTFKYYLAGSSTLKQTTFNIYASYYPDR